MTAEDLDARTAGLVAEESALRERLRELEDEIHSHLRRDQRGNAARIDEVEREIRRIVLRLVANERERIELAVAASL
jgi:hypothetical protein